MTAEAGAHRRRGQPLVALALLLTAWTAARFVLWESPFAPAARATVERFGAATAVATEEPPMAAQVIAPPVSAKSAASPPVSVVSAVWPARARSSIHPVPTEYSLAARLVNTSAPEPRTEGAAPGIAPWIMPPRHADQRFHLAAWAAWRQGSGLPQVANGALLPSYGGSQAGFLAQYDLAGGPPRPALHLRATYAPDRPRQAEIAAGIGVRPVAAIPVRVLGEMRATRVEGQTEARPALFAVTEIAPVTLPLGFRAEGYAQGGWVGGRYATAFVDGQARVTHSAIAAGPARLRIGAGAWGGAQKFAERIDVGPTITADFSPVHLALDYRMRVAGNARPGNGLALTVSTGF